MKIFQYDNFALDAIEVRNEVIGGTFSIETGPDGAKYSGISQHQVPQWTMRIANILRTEIVPKISCFRLNLEGELPHSWVHSDGICAQWASVLYLNLPDQCRGGTAFWKHKKLEIDRLPAGESSEYYKQMDLDWKDLELWEQLMLVPMKWNRFITYPTSLFHSRFPFDGFGKSPLDGRLIWICFYDRADGKTE